MRLVVGVEDLRVKRKLAAILIADVVGYSRLMRSNEEATYAQMQLRFKELVEPQIVEHCGRLIGTRGDGLLAEFGSAVEAVRCGLAVQRGMAERNSGLEPDRRIELRMGINVGDVILDGTDIYGDGVNIAARLEGLANPGEIYVTEGVREPLRGHPLLSFQDLGEHRVKNIDRPIHVFRVRTEHENVKDLPAIVPLGTRVLLLARATIKQRWFSVTSLGAVLLLSSGIIAGSFTPWRISPRFQPRASIVILPFTNLSSDPEQEYFADAVTDDLTTDASRLSDTFVIARATAFMYKGKAFDLRQISRDLGVHYALQGSIRKIGSAIQTNAQLIDAQQALHIWAERFDVQITDILKMQSEITSRIAASLDLELVKERGRRATIDTSRSPDAVDLRMRGSALIIESNTPEHTLAARKLFEEAVQLDPRSAEAWSWLARVLASDYLNRWNHAGKSELGLAEDAARRALSNNPGLALAHFATGLTLRAKGEYDAAIAAFDRTLASNPNFADAFAQKANALINLGRPQEAPELARKAIELSPRDPSIGIFYWVIGRAYFFTTRYEDAIPWLERSIEVRPNISFNRLYLAASYVLTGRVEKGRATLAEFNNQFPGYTLALIDLHNEDVPTDNPIILAGLQQWRLGLQGAGMPEH